MSRVIERVTKLVALATSPNENEARNAAYQACRLIREHRLTVVEAKETVHRWTVVDATAVKRPTPPPAYVPTAEEVAEATRRAAESERAEAWWKTHQAEEKARRLARAKELRAQRKADRANPIDRAKEFLLSVALPGRGVVTHRKVILGAACELQRRFAFPVPQAVELLELHLVVRLEIPWWSRLDLTDLVIEASARYRHTARPSERRTA
jgi:hypothetical protein